MTRIARLGRASATKCSAARQSLALPMRPREILLVGDALRSRFAALLVGLLIPDSGILLYQISIGHAGDVIAHRSMQPFALDPPSRRISKPAWIEQVTFENFSQHLTRAFVYLRHPRMVVDILIQKLPERAIGLCQIVTISNEDRLIPDVVS